MNFCLERNGDKMKNTKKGKIIMTFVIGLLCFVLMAIMFMQFKLVNETDITSIETMRKSELTTELASWKQKYDETNSKYLETQLKLSEYQNSEKSSEESKELMKQELNQVNIILGKTDVEGQGIIVTVNDKKDVEATDIASIKADDLLTIVNSLKLSGAEAISINEQRIINSTDIVFINNLYIKINQKKIESPYVIKAIGNQTYMESALVGSGGYVDELRKLGHDIQIEKNNRLLIKKYEEDIQTKYMN